jgi:hypothetical protein
MFPPSSQNSVGFCNQITPLILYYISSRVVTLLKVIDAHMQVSDIFYLTVTSKFTNFSFQIFLLFFPEIPQNLISALRFQILVVYNFL